MKTGEVKVVEQGTQMVYIPPDPLQRLREPFPPEQVGKLPRVWCKACKEAGKGKTCSDTEHKIVKCQVCGQKGTSAHLHLDYVGHAEVTHRLLDADPHWSWEPFGVDANGLPAIHRDGDKWSLWIRLTVGGVTRPGVGCVTVERFTSEPYKQLISDALRNAAMRFGVALDLWAKTDLDHTIADDQRAPADAGQSDSRVGIPTTDPAPSSGGGDVGAAPSTPSPVQQPQVAEPDQREEAVPTEDSSATSTPKSRVNQAGAGSAPAPADPLLDADLRALIDQVQKLPLQQRAEARAEKERLKIKDWAKASPDQIRDIKAFVAQLEVPA